MNCPKCGKALRSTEKFCENCGAQVPAEMIGRVEESWISGDDDLRYVSESFMDMDSSAGIREDSLQDLMGPAVEEFDAMQWMDAVPEEVIDRSVDEPVRAVRMEDVPAADDSYKVNGWLPGIEDSVQFVEGLPRVDDSVRFSEDNGSFHGFVPAENASDHVRSTRSVSAEEGPVRRGEGAPKNDSRRRGESAPKGEGSRRGESAPKGEGSRRGESAPRGEGSRPERNAPQAPAAPGMGASYRVTNSKASQVARRIAKEIQIPEIEITERRPVPVPAPEPEWKKLLKNKRLLLMAGAALVLLLLLILLFSRCGADPVPAESTGPSGSSQMQGGGHTDPKEPDAPADTDPEGADAPVVEPDPAETTKPTETEAEPVYKTVYEVIQSPMSWEDAAAVCIGKGGHLATIDSYDEYEKISKLAAESGLTYLWLGAKLTPGEYDLSKQKWVTGESMSGEKWFADLWFEGEPSFQDKTGDGAEENYLCIWAVGGWTLNDQRNDLASAEGVSDAKIGYVLEKKVEVTP